MPLARLPQEDVEFVLVARRWCTPVVAELTVRMAQRAIDFVAGQYVLLQDVAGSVPVRSYSIANAPRTDGTLTFLVTAVPDGPTSSWLTVASRIGDRLLVSGPYGSFVADSEHAGPTLYLAGGSGLGPVRSLIEGAVLRSEESAAASECHTLVFSARTPADLIDEDTWTELARRHRWFDYVRTLTGVAPGSGEPPVGRVPDVLPDLLPELGSHAVYIAGSPGFVDACTRTVQRLGVHSGRLHTEEFYAEPLPWHAPASGSPSQPGPIEEEH